MRKLLFLFLVWLAWFSFFLDVHAATVTLGQNVILNGPYGRLTSKNGQLMATYTLYANGTFFFDLRGSEVHQGVYSFTAQSYGNGSFVLRFKAIQPNSVQVVGQSANTYNTVNGWQQITYIASQTSLLVLLFNGPVTASDSLFLAVTMMGGFMGIIGILSIYRMVKEEDALKRRMYLWIGVGYAVAGVVLSIVAVIIRGV